MQQKIENIDIKGFRGVKNKISLHLAGKSALFYGDNGTGKSTLTDAIEWFYKDSVEHLSSIEIDKTALRNFNLPKDESASVLLNFSKADLKSEKTLSVAKEKPVSDFSNTTTAFIKYRQNSEKENLLLRYRNLEDFIKAPRGEKLKYLSEIVGYGEVTKIKEAIQKSYNAIKSEIKSQGFENQIQSQQAILLEKLGTNIYTKEQLFQELNNLIGPLNTSITINSLVDIDSVIKKIKSPIDGKIIDELKFLQKCQEVFTALKSEIVLISTEYEEFFNEFKKIFQDVEEIKQILLKEVLSAGKEVLSNEIYANNVCPLCLKEERKKSLLAEIEKRLDEIEKSSKKLKEFERTKNLIKLTVEERIRRLDLLFSEPLMLLEKYAKIKHTGTVLKNKLSSYLPEINTKILAGKMIKSSSELQIEDTDFICNPPIKVQISQLNSKIPKDTSSDIRVKVEFAKTAFKKNEELNSTKQILEEQKKSLELLFNEFIKKQKEGLETFLSSFSTVINEYYQFMNLGEAFEDLKIIPYEDGEELKGLTIQFKFDGKIVSPPQKYFSESYINCLGLAFFLASVRAFNNLNKFIVLDDVISSFDSNHRKCFADLLFEKFSDYQIILLTHETEWFMYVKELAKGRGWLVRQINWSKDEGTHIEETPSELRELIEYQIAHNIETQLGNSIRKYLESILKQICLNLEVKTNFRFNDQNEKRMPDELISALKSKINKKSSDLKKHIAIIDRVANSNILGNLLSHDNPYTTKMGDMRAFWTDVINIENLLFCKKSKCNSPVSIKNYDNVDCKIRCNCGKVSYAWKK